VRPCFDAGEGMVGQVLKKTGGKHKRMLGA
jgi:hypothetical protein